MQTPTKTFAAGAQMCMLAASNTNNHNNDNNNNNNKHYSYYVYVYMCDCIVYWHCVDFEPRAPCLTGLKSVQRSSESTPR